MNANGAKRMPLLDLTFYLLDSIRSPQDFALILHLSNPPDVESLKEGAASAMNRFPTSASTIEGRKWVWREDARLKFEISNSEDASALETFIAEPFDLKQQSPIKQVLIGNGSGGARLVTRFHHAAADGLSAALWLGHQLNVAYGLEPVQRELAPFADLPLRRLGTSVRRSEFAFAGASDPLWTSQPKCSGARSWLTIGFPATALQRACRRVRGFTYNDLLATCALEALRQWNCKYGRSARIGLWMPMNIRRDAANGFGNGTSRIRVYARYKPGASLVEKCRDVRGQVSWTTKHGEWVVPQWRWLSRLPPLLTRRVLRSYLNRPSVDMGTAVFSHAASWMAHASEAFRRVDKIECVGLLHPRQSLAINAATHCEHTWLTLTYDRHSLAAADVQQLAGMYQQQIALAGRELL